MYITGFLVSHWQRTRYQRFRVDDTVIKVPSQYRTTFETLAVHSVLHRCHGVVALSIYRRCNALYLCSEGESWRQEKQGDSLVTSCRYTCYRCEGGYCPDHGNKHIRKRVTCERTNIDGGFDHGCSKCVYLVFISSYTTEGALSFLAGEHLEIRHLHWSTTTDDGVYSGLEGSHWPRPGTQTINPNQRTVWHPRYDSFLDYTGMPGTTTHDGIVLDIPDSAAFGHTKAGICEYYDDVYYTGPDYDFCATVGCPGEKVDTDDYAQARAQEARADHFGSCVELVGRHQALKRFTIAP